MNKHIDCSVCIHKSICADYNKTHSVDYTPDCDYFTPSVIEYAKWEDTYNNGDWHCTKCGAIVEKEEQINHNWYYCYHCGCRMGADT